MTATTTRTTTPSRRRSTGRSPYGAYVDGANALQLAGSPTTRELSGYADPLLDDPFPAIEPDFDRVPPAAPAEPDAEVASTPTPMALPRTSFILLMGALVVTAVLGVLVLNTKINENSFTLDNLQSQQSTLDGQEQQLSQQLADLESTGNLSAQAARLGLVPAGNPAYLTLPNGRVVGVPQPASGSSTTAGTGAPNATTGDPGR
jgi:hypothetical protein